MITVYQSNNFKKLAARLSRSLAEKGTHDPLTPSVIVVPNRDTAGWLKRFIAGQNGIAANLQFMLPAEWQWSLVRDFYPGLPDLLPTDRQPIFWALCELLLNNENLDQFPELKQYLENREKAGREEAVRQLARSIASVFDQYLNYRPEMILRWQQGNTGTGDEKWQAELWNLLNRNWKKNHNSEQPYNRAELLIETADKLGATEPVNRNPLWVFNLGLIPKPVVTLMEQFGKQHDLELFLVLPSKTTGEPKNELLSAFGSDTARTSALFDFPGSRIESEFSVGEPEHLLQHLRGAISENRKMENHFDAAERNERIRIKSCHSPLREMEVLHRFLLEQFLKDESLNPEDVLVVMPNLEEYQPAIDAVFGTAEPHLPNIPYTISLFRSSEGKEAARVFRQLLAMPGSRFEFEQVMDLFMAGPVHTHFGISAAEAEQVRRWMEENHVVWGIDAEHRQEFDQPPSHLQTWNAAVRSTWLGQWMGTRQGETVNGRLLYNAVDGISKKTVWAAFSKYLAQLNSIRQQSREPRPPVEWYSLLEEWLRQIAGTKHTRELFKIITKGKEIAETAQVNLKVPFSMVRAELESELESHSSGTARFSNGVVFSSMVPVRSIPFKIVALTGLSEEQFPRQTVAPGFDLTVKNPGPSDRNRKEEDRNLFLESLLAAEEIHYCSFVGQNRVDNEPMAISPVIAEWAEFLGRLTGEREEEIIEKEPLTALSPVNFSGKGSWSVTEQKTAEILFGDEKRNLAGLHFGKPLPAGQTVEEGIIELNRLQSYYSNPVRNFLTTHFELRLPGEDNGRDEFELDNLQKHLLFQRVFGWKLQEIPEDQIFDLLLQSGALPGGWPGRKALNEMLQNTDDAIRELQENEITIEKTVTELDINAGGFRVRGAVQSWSPDHLLEVTASGSPERALIKTWIGYLALLSRGENRAEAEVLYNLKKDPAWYRFKPVENPQEHLEKLLQQYLRALEKPEPGFPKTSFAFEEEEGKGKDGNKKAKTTFEASEYNIFAESADEYVKLILGPEPGFEERFTSGAYQQFIKTMRDHLEEI